MNRLKYVLTGAGLGILLAAAAMAQTTFGVIRGRVLDATGAPVPGVKVTVTNTGTNIAKTLTTADSGAYEAGYLQPGTYSVTAEAAGFKKFVSEGLVLNANAIVLVDANLTVGDLTSSVTVEAGGAPLISTETAVISDIKTQQQYLQAPMNVRGNWDSFLYIFMSLVPGAQPTLNSFSISFAGTRYTMNNFTVDGITTNSTLYGNQVGPANPSMDFVREVRVDMSGNSAEFAAPGYVNVVTKGGENQFHGSAYWYYNSAGGNARNYFQDRVAFSVLNDWGFTVSGPVRKNKTFFSGGLEGFNQHTAALFNLNLPSASVLGGDFSKMTDALNRPLNKTIINPLNNQPFPGNQIPASMLNSAALKTQARFFPAPNYGGPEQVADNYRGMVKQMQRKEQVDIRVDHTFSDKNSLFGRFDAMRAPNGTWEGYLPTIGPRVQKRQTRNFVLSDTHTFRPNLINEFRFGLMRGYNPYSGPIDGPTAIKEMGLTNLPANLPELQALPIVAVSNFTQISQIDYARGAEMIYQWQDNISWIKGRHTIKMGGEVWRNYAANFGVSPSRAYGSINFTGDYTGYSYADFMLGIPRSGSRSSAGFVRLKSTNLDKFLFVQDDFKVHPRLTLNLGLRYELNPPYVEKEDRTYSFNPYTGQMVVPTEAAKNVLFSGFVNSKLVPVVTAGQAGLPRALGYTYKKNFAPRIGFAYKLTSDNKTVLRSGYGIFYDSFTGQLWRQLVGGPYNGSESVTANTITNGVPMWQWPDMFPRTLNQVGTASLNGVDPHIRQPYTQQWNVTLEREIWNMGLRASYVGTKSHKLVMYRNLNQLVPSTIPYSASRRPYPQLSGANWFENMGNAYYNALMLIAERKFKSGVQYQASYTWAKNLTDDQTEGEGGQSPQNAYDRRSEWGDYQYTRRQRLTFNSIVEVPFGRGKRLFSTGPASHILGGWSISLFGLLQTGPYFTPTVTGGDPANVGSSGGRPDRIGSGQLSNPTLSRWFDTSAFVAAPANAGRFGNSGVNILRAPGTRSMNAGMFKKFAVKEWMKVQIEATFTNVFNHPNFAAPSTTVNSASGGLINSMQGLEGAGPRTTRLGARLDF